MNNTTTTIIDLDADLPTCDACGSTNIEQIDFPEYNHVATFCNDCDYSE